MAGYEWMESSHPTVIGMLHLPPLAGSPNFQGNWSALVSHVLTDATALRDGGVSAMMLENYGDVPFYPGRVPAETIAQMTALAQIVQQQIDCPLGINVLRNDGRSALAIARAVNAAFIRVNVLCGARLADQGILSGIAHDLLRDRTRLGCESIAILADVDVKHSVPLAAGNMTDEVRDLIHRGGADGLIVSGTGTGQQTSPDQVARVAEIAEGVPLFVGSGVNADTLTQFLPAANGFIVGTSLKKQGLAENPVDADRVRKLMETARSFS